MSAETDLMQAHLPAGVVLRRLTVHADPRGSLKEIYRQEWGPCDAVQFNCVVSAPNVLRGVHVHVEHTDHVVMVTGGMLLGLHDMRPWSPDFRRSCMRQLEAAEPVAVAIPPGVAHGFYFASPSMLVYGTSTYWDTDDELACSWNAPELGFSWPTQNPLLSERDSHPTSYAEVNERFLARWQTVHGSRVTA
jgi:dTDP-4-dehydrorhamnose 3,5-epimerase